MFEKNRKSTAPQLMHRAVRRIAIRTALFLVLMTPILQAPLILDALDVQRDILQRAQRYAGTEYCHGGVAPPCFDCSGFVLRLYNNFVPGMPRVSRDMVRFGRAISREELRPGDLVFFATGGRADIVTHVAIYMGQDSIIHAISNGPSRGVTITPLSAQYWDRRFYGATRVLPQATQVEEVRRGEAIQFSRGAYTGELQDGEPHGAGEMAMHNGDRYRGEFRNGLFEGSGEYTWADGSRYAGRFLRGEMHGEGTFVTAAGVSDSGRWDQGTRVAAPARDTTSRRTYIRSQDSPWETWQGVVEGDFRAWQQQERDAFEEHRRRTEPSRR